MIDVFANVEIKDVDGNVLLKEHNLFVDQGKEFLAEIIRTDSVANKDGYSINRGRFYGILLCDKNTVPEHDDVLNVGRIGNIVLDSADNVGGLMPFTTVVPSANLYELNFEWVYENTSIVDTEFQSLCLYYTKDNRGLDGEWLWFPSVEYPDGYVTLGKIGSSYYKFNSSTISGISGITGIAMPDWSSAPNIGNTVVDNDITWTNTGDTLPINYSNDSYLLARLRTTRSKVIIAAGKSATITWKINFGG